LALVASPNAFATAEHPAAHQSQLAICDRAVTVKRVMSPSLEVSLLLLMIFSVKPANDHRSPCAGKLAQLSRRYCV
jgi:hypothetical protein